MFIELDLTKTDIVPEGTYTAIVADAEVKTAKAGSNYISWRFFIPELAQSVFHNTSYLIPRMVKEVVVATGIRFDENGFDLTDCLNKQVMVTVAVKDDPNFGLQNNVVKITKA